MVGKSDKQPLVSRRSMVVGGGAFAALLGVGYCASRTSQGKPGPFGLGGGYLLFSLTGSNMVSLGPAPALVKAFMESKGYTGVEIHPGMQESDVTGWKNGKSARVHFTTSGSDDAFKELGAGTTDIGMTSRRVRPDEVRSLAAQGDMDTPACEHVIGLNGIAVIVNPDNPVSQLSMEQLANIYMGRILNWSEVGGQDMPIHLVSHTVPSGMVDFFKDVALKGGEIAPSAKLLATSTELSNAVLSDPQAISMVGLSYILDAKAVAISASATEGVRYVLPNLLTVKSEIYPITCRLYLYTPAHPNNLMVSDFVRFAASSDGQAVVAESHYVRYDVERLAGGARAVTTAANAPDEYRDLTRDADLLQIIYFNMGSRTPQPLAMKIMDTLPNKLEELNLKPGQLMLFGFTDNVGSSEFNLNLSRERVSQIAKDLDIRGIKTGKIEGYGGTNFLRSNHEDADRQYNRRVEIWARKT